jgi:hypothetical protein
MPAFAGMTKRSRLSQRNPTAGTQAYSNLSTWVNRLRGNDEGGLKEQKPTFAAQSSRPLGLRFGRPILGGRVRRG